MEINNWELKNLSLEEEVVALKSEKEEEDAGLCASEHQPPTPASTL